MAKGIYFGVGSKARKVTNAYIGVNGVARKVVKGYIGVGGVARLFYTGVEPIPLSDLPIYTLLRIQEVGVDTLFYTMKDNYESDLNGTGRRAIMRYRATEPTIWNASGVNQYADSDMDKYLNTTYKNRLPSAVQELMGTTTFECAVGNGDKTVTTLSRSVFIPSMQELGYQVSNVTPVEGEYLDGVNKTTLRTCGNDSGKQVDFWMRSMYALKGSGTNTSTGANKAHYRNVTAGQSVDFVTASHYPRPCFTLPNTLMVDGTPNADGSYNLILE